MFVYFTCHIEYRLLLILYFCWTKGIVWRILTRVELGMVVTGKECNEARFVWSVVVDMFVD